MKKSKGLFWIVLVILLFLFLNRKDAPAEPAAPSATAAPVRTFTPVPTLTIAPSTPDPLAYEARNWWQLMPTPSRAQIDAVSGSARSPYISIYPQFSGVKRASECSVDLHTDHQPLGTYLCPMNWWMDVSALEARYASVYNDYTGTPGGYCGFQSLGDGSHVFIMTVWSTFCQDRSGNVTVFTPKVIYPEGQGKQNNSDAEGSFTQCILPYDWKAGRDYRFLLQATTSDLTGNTVFTVFVCDLQRGEWAMMASFDTGVADVWISSLGCFLEDFLTEYAGEVRSMELRNVRAHPTGSLQWVSADSVQFLLNGSVSQLDYGGSASFGTDGCAIWAITSGVSGLCSSPSGSVTYPLAPGDSRDPY